LTSETGIGPMPKYERKTTNGRNTKSNHNRDLVYPNHTAK